MANVEALEVDVMFVQMKEILKLLNSELLNKIPEKIKNYILNYESSNNYKFIYDRSKRLNDQNLTEDTRHLIAYFDYYYWANDVERKEIDRIWDEKELTERSTASQVSEIQSDVDITGKVQETPVVNTNIVTNNTNEIVQEAVHENKDLIVKKESFIDRLFNKIKSIFSKK